MVRKASVALFTVLVLVLLGGLFLMACETAGGPQATATPPSDLPKPTATTATETEQDTPPTPQHVQPYPEELFTQTPTLEAYPNP